MGRISKRKSLCKNQERDKNEENERFQRLQKFDRTWKNETDKSIGKRGLYMTGKLPKSTYYDKYGPNELEARNQCFCGTDFTFKDINLSLDHCSSSRVGNRSQICGGTFALSVYNAPKSGASSASTDWQTKWLKNMIQYPFRGVLPNPIPQILLLQMPN
ncbi:7756_t:CDS:2 [Diversispora eburnea]|uniref:7756_t:CDS:1 n=1 Tax=Diversispora eburnea TaxID=1213867 RepID=A0A9N9F6M0_9GLOM|nr:7756_t:CDS:2 [Diversispora eburnea]